MLKYRTMEFILFLQMKAFFVKSEVPEFGAGRLILTNLTLYCTDIEPYKSYADPLPLGLDCSDGRDAVRDKLGAPEVAIDHSRLDRWTKEGVWVFCVYRSDLQSLERMGIQLPDPS